MPQVDWVYPSTWQTTATTTEYVLTNTWDVGTSSARPVVWDGGVVTLGPPNPPALPEVPEKAVDWLRRRVEEYRVPLLEAA